VHGQLLALGFEKYVASLRKRKETHLFPIWYREGMAAKAKAPRVASFNLYVRRRVMMSDGAVIAGLRRSILHSFWLDRNYQL
jgi:hypothetical protein